MRFPSVGDTLVGRYRLDRVLGEGGFARVFEATDTTIARRVALKVLKPQADEHGTRARFHREVEIIANLSDPHTVTVFDWGATSDGLLYMVFEYVDGRDLVEVLEQRGTLDEASAEKILRQVLSSLREAHASNVLHRDLKPHNIRVYEYAGDPLCVKLLDFGIAKPLHDGAAITADGAVVGSPRYMAPEHLLSKPLTPASDLYSLGLVLYEMLLGRDIRGSHLYEQLERVQSNQPLEVPAGAPVSPRMRELLRGLLEPDVARRFRSADDVFRALEPPPLQAPPQPRAAVGPPAGVPTMAELPQKPRDAGKLMMVAALTALALAAVTGVAMWLSREPEPPARAMVRPQFDPRPAKTRPPESEDVTTVTMRSVDGCGTPPPFRGAGLMESVDVLSRTSWGAYIPESYDAERRHEVLVFFHEDLDSYDETLKLSGFAEYAEERQVVILMPIDGSVRTWRGLDEVRSVTSILELAADALCLDTTQGVLAFGHGTGGRAAERLGCVTHVRAVATSAHRPEAPETFCAPGTAVPYLHIAPLSDGYDPIDGSGGCGAAKISLDELERRWRERNGCADKRRTKRHKGGRCFEFDCETAFISCHARGGHRWPGQTSRPADVQGCDGGPMMLPVAEIVWSFFDRYLVETAIEP